ncbi:MAG: hypothetical protein ACRD8U_04495 [Pyrinomonadaceae bacterium]
MKAGKRFRKFGIFGKARPGVVSFSGGDFDVVAVPAPPPTFPGFIITRKRANNFALDVGGVIELYHSRRIFTRFDGGDTIIWYPNRSFSTVLFDETGAVRTFPIIRPADTRHNFQVSAGIGIRF